MTECARYTELRLFEPQNLASSEHLSPLCELINAAFLHGHTKGKQLLPSEVKRLESASQLLSEIDAEGFVLVMFIDSEIIATASAKPFKPLPVGQTHGSEMNMLFKRKPKITHSSSESNGNPEAETQDIVDADIPSWELLAMAVKPSLQGQGFATRLLNASIDEIKRRLRMQTDGTDHRTPGKFNVLISTMQELNEAYYMNKGWQTTDVKYFEAGTGGSVEGFHVVEMNRVFEYHLEPAKTSI